MKTSLKKDRDPTISAVTNIHTRFYIQIHEYPSTRILAAALIRIFVPCTIPSIIQTDSFKYTPSNLHHRKRLELNGIMVECLTRD